MLICRLMEHESSQYQVKKCLFQHNQFIKRNPGVVSLLHLMVFKNYIHRYPLKLLLEFGADPNAIDFYGNTPFHLLTNNQFFCESMTDVVDLLLAAGIHHDQANANGETAFDLRKRDCDTFVRFTNHFDKIVPSLHCCCAKVLAKFPLLDNTYLFNNLSFVRSHAIGEGKRSATWRSDYDPD